MPKISTKAKSPNKSAFIRNLPADMPAAEVVTKAKAANLKLTPAFVYAIRSKVRNKGRKGRPAAAAPAAKRGPKPASGKPSASDFVRAQPASMKAGDVVAAGAKQGLKFSTNLVYAVRSSGGRRARGAAGRAPRAGRASVAATGSEATFRKLALELGISRARTVLDELEKRLRELIDG
jgi:hypothetical protein